MGKSEYSDKYSPLYEKTFTHSSIAQLAEAVE